MVGVRINELHTKESIHVPSFLWFTKVIFFVTDEN